MGSVLADFKVKGLSLMDAFFQVEDISGWLGSKFKLQIYLVVSQ